MLADVMYFCITQLLHLLLNLNESVKIYQISPSKNAISSFSSTAASETGKKVV